MNIIIGILCLVVLSECNLSRGDSHPVIDTTYMSKKYDWSVLNNIVMNMLKPTTPQPTTSTLPPANEETSSPGTETQEELIARLFQEMESEPASSPQLPLNHKTSTPAYLLTASPTTTSSPISVPRRIKPHQPQSSSNDAGSFLLPTLGDPELERYRQPPSNHFQYSQPSAPQQYEMQPPFQYVPQEFPVPYNTLPFYNNLDWTSPMMPARSETPYYHPSYIPDEIPVHSFHPVPYQSPLMPMLTREQTQSQLPQIQNSPSLNHGSVLIPSLNGNTGADYDPSPILPFLNNPPQTRPTQGHIVSTFVRSYIPQQQFQPLQFHVFQPPIVSSQPALYLPASPQLSQDNIISLIQRSHQSSSPGVVSPASNLPSFPFKTFSNQPNFAPVTTNTREVSTPYSSVPIKTQAPLPYYREPRAPVTSDGSHFPVSMFAGLQPPIYDDLRDLHFV